LWRILKICEGIPVRAQLIPAMYDLWLVRRDSGFPGGFPAGGADERRRERRDAAVRLTDLRPVILTSFGLPGRGRIRRPPADSLAPADAAAGTSG
jgi:hypothetical protein